MRVTFYTRAGCPHCDRLRAQLALGEDRVTEVDLTRHPEATTELLKLTGGRRIVPVLVRAGKIEVAPEGGSEF